MRGRCFVPGLILSLFLALSGIALSAPPAIQNGATPAEGRPGYGGTLVVGVSSDVDTFDPLFAESKLGQEILHLFLLGLADLNENAEFVPELAESWEHAADYRTLTFHLRKNAVWADGVPITADDVKFTFDLKMDSTVASPRLGETEFIKAVTVLDPHTVRFTFTEPYPDQLFDTAGEILPKHRLENIDRKALRSSPFGGRPLASGPFRLKKWVRQQYIEIVPNEKFFGGRPYLDRVIFKIIPDQTNLLLQLRTGEIDMMVGVPPQDVARLEKTNPNIAIYPTSGRVYYYIGYNAANPLFEDAAVRRALTMALNRDGLIKALLHGFGTPCYGPIPPIIGWAYTEDVATIPNDPQAAKAALASAGWRDHDGDGWLDRQGQRFEFTLLGNTGNQIRADLGMIVQAQLKKIGIKVDLALLEWTTYLDRLREPGLQAWLGGWGASFNVDPTPLFHSSAVDLFNYVHFANPDIDRLIESGRREMNRQRAAKIWQQFQKRLYREQPYTFLFWIDKIVAVHERFKNVTPIALSAFYNLEKWYDSRQRAGTR